MALLLLEEWGRSVQEVADSLDIEDHSEIDSILRVLRKTRQVGMIVLAVVDCETVAAVDPFVVAFAVAEAEEALLDFDRSTVNRNSRKKIEADDFVCLRLKIVVATPKEDRIGPHWGPSSGAAAAVGPACRWPSSGS